MKKQALEESIQKKFDLDVVDQISKNLRYPNDTTIVDKPSDQRFYSNEAEDDELWVWAGFVPPGAYTFQVNDILNGQLQQTFLVGPRMNEVQFNKFVNLASDE